MSSRRVTVSGPCWCAASTAPWPVSEASTAICAVSRSRISPTITTPGSAREGTQGLGQGPVDLGFHLHPAQALLGDFDRILGGPDLALRVLMSRPSAACSVVVCCCRWGPRSTMPYGRSTAVIRSQHPRRRAHSVDGHGLGRRPAVASPRPSRPLAVGWQVATRSSRLPGMKRPVDLVSPVVCDARRCRGRT